MSWRKVIFIFLIILVIFIAGLIIRKKINEIQYRPYKEYINLLKPEEYYLAYKNLYPLIRNRDDKAINFISDAYLSGDGISKDLIKSNILRGIASTKSFNVGTSEYDQFKIFLDRENYGMASVFLQKSAEKGNKDAINLLKNEKYLKENKLIVDPRWIKYWRDFDYENLYPYCQEIEACRKDVEAVKNKRLNH